MFGLPAWAVSLLIKLAIDFLERENVISSVSATAARLAAAAKFSYQKQDFPGGVNGKADAPFIDTPGKTNTNMESGHAPPKGPNWIVSQFEIDNVQQTSHKDRA